MIITLYNKKITYNKQTGEGLGEIIALLDPKIKSLAFQYHVENMTPKDIESELCLVISKATSKYNKNKGYYSTFIWRCMANHCINLQKRHKKPKNSKSLFHPELYNNIIGYNYPDAVNYTDIAQVPSTAELSDLETILGTDYPVLYAKYVTGISAKELRDKFYPMYSIEATRTKINKITAKYRSIFNVSSSSASFNHNNNNIRNSNIRNNKP